MQIVAEWAGHFYDPGENSDKIWASACTDTGDYLSVWGRRGNRKYQSLTKRFGNVAAARFEFDKMVRQKEHKGYQNVPFENPHSGNIPSFKNSLGGNIKPGPGPGKITRRGLLERIVRLISRVKERFEPDTMLVEFQQLQAVTGLVLEYNEQIGTGSDKETTPHELESGMDTLAECIRQALLA
jgi:predicted DNA-binding WGR domain protein